MSRWTCQSNAGIKASRSLRAYLKMETVLSFETAVNYRIRGTTSQKLVSTLQYLFVMKLV